MYRVSVLRALYQWTRDLRERNMTGNWIALV
jgi:hypothetical protein